MPPFIVSLITKLLTFTDGYKTIFSAIGFFGYAVYLAFSQTPPDVDKAIQNFLLGLAALGIGHKIAKNTAAQGINDGPVTVSTLQKPVNESPRPVV